MDTCSSANLIKTQILSYLSYMFFENTSPIKRGVCAVQVQRPNCMRSISASSKKLGPLSDEEMREGCRLGMDSHADVSCVGRHARITEVFHGKTCNVLPFNDSYDAMTNIQTVNASFAFDSIDGRTYILNVNQGLDFTTTMEHSLLCPNQSRAAGVVIDDVPKFLDYSKKSTHSIWFPQQDLRLPLLMNGPISFLPVRYPTDDELNHCNHFDLTSYDEWDPTFFDDIDKGVSSVEQLQNYSNDLSNQLASHVCVNAVSHGSTSDVTPESLAKLWHVGLPIAKRTLQVTTQDYMRKLSGKVSRRVKTKAHQNRYKQLGGYLSMFCSDTFHSKVKSLRGNTYIQLFCNRGNYVRSYPIESKSNAHHGLDRFLHEVGIPSELLTDGARELVLSEWGKICRRYKVRQITTEPHSPWQNPAELAGGQVKRKVRRVMKITNTPVVLWDYCWEYISSLRCITAVDNAYLDGLTPFSKVHGYTPDISEYLTFKWFDWVWYHEPVNPDKELLGRWLGPAHNIGQGLAYHVLSDSGMVKIRSTVTPVSPESIETQPVQERMQLFTKTVESIIGNFTKSTQARFPECTDDPYESMFEVDDLDDELIEPQEVDLQGNVIPRPDLDGMDDAPYLEMEDKFIGAKVPLPHPNGEMIEATVKSRKRTATGMLKGTEHDNPMMDTRVYEVEFPDGSYDEYAANVLIENLYQHIDDDGKHHSILRSIVDHDCDSNIALSMDEGTYECPKSGVLRKRITTKGWKLKVEWKDGTQSWIPLKTLKESNPIEVAEYSVAHEIHKQPAFAWWAPHVLRKRDRIIKQVQHRKVKKNLKYGIKIPNSVAEAIRLDKENGNNLWRDAINKEMKNVLVAFKLLKEGEVPLPGSKRIPYHIIFDARFDLTRKARLVAGGHMHKDVPSYDTYSSVVSRDSVRMLLMIAALNDLDVLSADIGNAYLNARNKERVHVICGPELFGPEAEGKTAVIVRALYGLKSAGNAWRHHFSTYIRTELGYETTVADNDVYRKATVKPDGTKCYSYFIVYVDDIISIDTNPKRIMNKINNDFRLKDGIDTPKMYLGTDVKAWDNQMGNGLESECWALGSQTYLKEAVKVCENLMKEHGLEFSSSKRACTTPFSNQNYRPELEDSAYCGDVLANVYQNLIGVLRWMCELGRIDVLHEVSILSQYLAQPRTGHLQQVINIFHYAKKYNRSWIVLDPTRFDIDWIPTKPSEVHPDIRAKAMKDIYTDAQESLPHNMPEPRGKEVDITVFVDADHAGNRVTRRSHTGVIIFVNMAPVIWYSKRQNTVETSTFGSEFIALRIALELTEALRYKLRMFGVPISGPARILCDNKSVVDSSSYPESRLKKKHCSIAYHRIREAVAAGTILIYFERSATNLADLLTKPLVAAKREPLVQAIMS